MASRHRRIQSSPLIDLFESRSNVNSTIKEAQKDTCKIFVKGLESGVIEPEDVTIDDLFEVFVWPQVEQSGKPFDIRSSDFSEIREEMTSSQFLYATSKLVHPMMIRAYEDDIGPVMALVTETESNSKIEDIVGTTDGDRARFVEEATPYPESGLAEKHVSITNYKYGHGVTITAEMLRFDKTGELQKRCKSSGSYIADVVEDTIVSRVTDQPLDDVGETTSQAFIYGGTRYALYHATTHATVDGQLNPNSYNTVLTPSRTSTKAMINLLKGMKSEKGRKIRIRPRIVFGSDMMEEELDQFFNLQEYDINSAERNRNGYKSRFQLVTSPYTATTTEWYIGDFARQFRLQWVWRPRTSVDSVGDAKRDIVAGFYSSVFFGVGAEDYRFVVLNPGA